MRILVVDDELPVCESLELYMKQKGHEVVTCQEFHQADAALLVDKFDLIFLDYRLSSQHTGKDLLVHAKRLNLKTPIVMMSAYKTRDNEFHLRNLGAQHYLAKPFKLAEIDAILDQISESQSI